MSQKEINVLGRTIKLWRWRQERRVTRIDSGQTIRLDFGPHAAILYEIGVRHYYDRVPTGEVRLTCGGIDFFVGDATALITPCRLEPAAEFEKGIYIRLNDVDRWLDIIVGLYFKEPLT